MHPDVLNEPGLWRGRLSPDPIPEFGRAEATRRLVRAAAENPYPHCPRCGRALLALARTRFACPDGHAVITLPSRRPALWRWVLLAFSHRRVGASA
jgi:hypothetical protein